ncbi:carbohydrate-binding module family 63 protein [Oidiodendron maius Zn]|uniref:Carbohydrate-binding module family 63 protein n=1 Tax=Oidiodendron maius (strain Zn) TaxID=913774 RepID=A0A0C3GH97_OIDMZ|nr:carbohydrate-binding module family 63 protein [Oidiodendron maius Zn]
MHFTTAIVASTVLALATASSLSGQATYYGGNLAGGACSFSTYTLPSGIFGTALSDSNWDNSANCGACVSVTGPSGNSITAMIVDECPGCGTNHLDLFPDAFSALANPTTGIIDVTWEYVDCPITTPLEVHNKEGVSAYWFSMQAVNANQGVSSLEVSTDGGSTWQSTTRQTYNFFENSAGFGTTTVDIKVTSDSGDVVIVNDVNISSGASTTASSNFGSSGSKVTSASAVTTIVASSSSSIVVAASTPVAESTTSSSAQVTGTASGVSQEVSSSGSDATTKTTLSSTTTLYKTITAPKSTSTSTTSLPSTSSSLLTSSSTYSVVTSSAVVNSSTALPSGYSISVMTISTCKPTVLYSVIPVPTSSSTATPIGTGVASYSANFTLPAATSTPTIFTGAASSMQVSFLLAAFTGLISFLI